MILGSLLRSSISYILIANYYLINYIPYAVFMSISVNEKQCQIFDEQGDVWMEPDGSGGINDKPCVFKLTMFWYCH